MCFQELHCCRGGDFSENYGTCGIKFAILILLVHMCIYGTAYLIKNV